MYGSEAPMQSVDGRFYDRVIPNYFDTQDFEFFPEFDEEDPYYLYIGRCISRKGIVIASQACDALGVKLKIAGQGGRVAQDGSFYSETDSSLRLPPGTWEYVGYADAKMRKQLMGHAIATFVPSMYLEPFGGTHVESMLCGTPAITTDFGVFPGTIPDALNGVVGFRCNTLRDFVNAGQAARNVNREAVHQYAQRFAMDRVKHEFQQWFDDLFEVYLSTLDPQIHKGWGAL